MAACAITVVVLFRREFRSSTVQALAQVRHEEDHPAARSGQS